MSTQEYSIGSSPNGSPSGSDRRISQASLKKDEGNAAFRDGDFRKAAFCYKQASMFLSHCATKNSSQSGTDDSNEGLISMFQGRGGCSEKLSKSEQVEVDEIYAATQSNLAGAHLKLGRYSEARDCATVALGLYGRLAMVHGSGSPETQCVLAPSHQRAYFRRAQAQSHLGNWDEARSDLRRLPMEDPLVAEQIRYLDSLEQQSVAKEKKMFARMFA